MMRIPLREVVIIVGDLVKECLALAGREEADPLRLDVVELMRTHTVDEDYGEDLDPSPP